MKRAERHHLKENEFVRLAMSLKEGFATRGLQSAGMVVAVAVVAAALVGYVAWRGRIQTRADTLLAEALALEEARVGPPPLPGTPSTGLSFATEREKQQAMLTRFKAVADAYPSTDAGIFARYREGAALVALGSPADAARAYQQAVDRGADSLYGQMARLGLAEAQARAGEYDRAIETFQGLTQGPDSLLPVDGLLMQLGRTYLEAGKPTEAQQTFSRIVEEFPNSPFSGEARQQLDSLNET